MGSGPNASQPNLAIRSETEYGEYEKKMLTQFMNVPLTAPDDDGHFRHPVASKGDRNASNVGTNRLKENAKGDFHIMTSPFFFHFISFHFIFFFFLGGGGQKIE